MNFASVLVLLLFFWPFSSGRTFHMASSNSVPAASGVVKAQIGGNGNTDLDIKVSHLAAPSSLVPPEAVYIVWVRPNGADAVKEGAIRVNNKLNGELKTVTTSKDFDVFITAEQGPTVPVPSGMEVLHVRVTMK